MAEDMIAVQAAEQEADLVALMDGRARMYGLMARLLLKEVDKAALLHHILLYQVFHH